MGIVGLGLNGLFVELLKVEFIVMCVFVSSVIGLVKR